MGFNKRACPLAEFASRIGSNSGKFKLDMVYALHPLAPDVGSSFKDSGHATPRTDTGFISAGGAYAYEPGPTLEASNSS